MPTKMGYKIGLVDTNILIYASSEGSIYQTKAINFLDQILTEQPVFVALQNLTEFYAIITSPKRVPKPVSPQIALAKIEQMISGGFYRIIVPKQTTPATLLVLLKKHSVGPSEVHDAHLAATMINNGIDTIYTADTKIFSRLGLKATNPLR